MTGFKQQVLEGVKVLNFHYHFMDLVAREQPIDFLTNAKFKRGLMRCRVFSPLFSFNIIFIQCFLSEKKKTIRFSKVYKKNLNKLLDLQETQCSSGRAQAIKG